MKTLSHFADDEKIPQHFRVVFDRVIKIAVERKYCAVLGPRFSGKTDLLNLVREELEHRSRVVVQVNLYDAEAAKPSDFFNKLANIISQQLANESKISGTITAGVSDSSTFRSFIQDVIDHVNNDFVLIIDHLEGVSNDLVRLLLTSLRAIYMEQENNSENRLVAIVAGALSLAGVATGETSPFRGIAELVIVDLPPDEESERYITTFFSNLDIRLSFAVQKYLIRVARGDRHLIKVLCDKCAQPISEKNPKKLSVPLVEKISQEFILNQAQSHAPLQEAVRLIENDPDLLACTLLLTKKSKVNKQQLPLSLSPDIDPFYLTGVVRKVGSDGYQFRNEIYRRFLTGYFNPGRVGHLLSMSGRWDQAIDYLETSIAKGNIQYRTDLLAATISSIYASSDINHGAEYLARGLVAGFNITKGRVWYCPQGREALKLVGVFGKGEKNKLAIGLEMPISGDHLEARSFQEARALRVQGNNGNIEWAIPLLVSDRQSVGVVYMVIQEPKWEVGAQRDWEMELTGYLHQAARALQEVETRQGWQKQLETLDQIALNIAKQSDIKDILQTAVEKATELVGGTGGGLYLWDDIYKVFTLETLYGLPTSLIGEKYPHDQGVIGEIRMTKQPFSVKDYYKWPKRQQAFDDYKITAVVGAPILSGDRLVGVIAIHDQQDGKTFQKEDEKLLLRVGNHVAAVFENAINYQYRECLISSSLDGIIAVDDHGWINVYNEGAERICGFHPGEMLNRKKWVGDLYDDSETAKYIKQEVNTTGKLENYETCIKNNEGKSIPILISASVLKDSKGDPSGSVGYFKDLRPLKKVENELKAVLDVLWTVAKSTKLSEGLAVLSEKMVTGLKVSLCLILLLDEKEKELKVRAAFPVQRSAPLVWEPPVGDTLDLKGLPIIECLSKMKVPRTFRKEGTNATENIILDYIQGTTALENDLQSVLAIPFRTEQDLYGVCVLGEIRRERNLFDEDKKKLATSMTDAVTVLIDRLHAQEVLHQRVTLAEELRKVSDAVAHLTTEAPKMVLDQIAQSICKMVASDCGMIYPYYEDLGIYDVRSIGAYGLRDEEKRFKPKPRMHPKSMTQVILQNKTPVIVDDAATGVDQSGRVQIWTEENKFIERERIRSFVGIGLWSGQEAVGALFVNFRNLHKVTDDELNNIRIFANQAAVAIQQSRHYQQGKKDHKVVLSTNKITQLIGSAEALHEVWQAILEGAMDVTGANRGRILSMNRFGNLVPEVALRFDGKSNARFQNQSYEPCPLVRWAVDNKEPLLISDMTDDSHPKPLRECCIKFCPNIKSVLAAPVLHNDAQNVLGVLVLESADWAAFSAYDKILMEAFVKYAGIAVQSAERIVEIQQGADLRSELLKTGQSITSLERSQEVLQSITDGAKTALGCDLVTLYTYDGLGEEIGFPPTISGNLKHPPALQKLGYVSKQSVVWKILQTGEPHFAENSLHDDLMLSDASARHKDFHSFVEREGICSSAGIPLLVGDEKVGILFVNYRTPHPFSENEQKNILLFATQAAIAIQNARSYKNLNQLKALYDAARVAGLDRKQLLDKILELAISITSASGGKATLGTIQIIDEQTHEREFTNVYPPSEYAKLRAQIGHRLSLDRTKTKDGRIGITGRAAIEKKPQLVLNVKKDPDYIKYSIDTKSELAIPLIDIDCVIGVLNVESDKINAFDTSDRDALIALADLTMIALKNQDHMRLLSRASTVATMGAWAADVVHDVKREVGNIRREAFLLLRDSKLAQEAQTRVRDIDRYAQELASLPTQPPKPGEALVGNLSLIDNVAQAEVSEWQQRFSDMTILFEGHCEDSKVAMCEQWIRRLLRHLIRNSLNAIHRENVTRRIVVQTNKSNEKVEVAVQDTGKGIQPKHIPKLFVEPILHEDGREGQGLLLVSHIVEQHGGDVGIKWNRPGEGVCIFFTIPIY